MLAYLLGAFAGVCQPLQTSINGKLTARLRSTFLTTVVSFGTAASILAIVLLITEGGISIPFARISANQPWWVWTGGCCGVIIVIGSIVALPHLGSAKTMMLTAFGQIVTGIVIDTFGLLESPQIDMTWRRLFGVLVVIGGVYMVSRQKDSSASLFSGYSFVALLVGVACGVQVAINGALATETDSAVKSTFVSMCVGLIVILLLIAVMVLIRGRDSIMLDAPADTDFRWWQACGGVLAVIIVTGNAYVSPIIGTGLANIMNLIGEMGGGLVIDAAGFLGIDKKPATPLKIHGVLVMILGTILIVL